MSDLTIGVDFGSDSARAVLVRAEDGAVLAAATCAYPRWNKGLYSDAAATRFRHHPRDYAEALGAVLHGVLDGTKRAAEVRAIAVDATASTPCLTDAGGQPLALRAEFADEPDAMFVLWKDHTGAAESREITEAAKAKGYARHTGNAYSVESGWSKVLHILRTNPRVAAEAKSVIEACDYVTCLLTGRAAARSHSAAGYKLMWSEAWGGYPPAEFFRGLGGERLAAIREALPRETAMQTEPAGRISAAWARELGLREDVTVGVGNLDAHSGAAGAGCALGTMVLTLGTSGVIMAVMPHADYASRFVDDVFGQVPDGILVGHEGFEAGLSAYGDCYAWVKRLVTEPMRELLAGVLSEAELAEAEARALPLLERKASALKVADELPLATDWFNGRRTPKPDPIATATVERLRIGTGIAELYWSVMEATAFGVRAIIEHYEANGVRAERFVAIGGIARKSPFAMQMLADVTGRAIEVPELDDACAFGAAIHAAVAAGLHPDVTAAQRAMCAKSATTHWPRAEQSHDRRYARYRELLGESARAASRRADG